jgi:transposase
VPPAHPAAFRRCAIALARARTKPIAEVAKDLQISESCLRNWVAQADADERGSQTRLTSAEKEELAQLRRDKRRLEFEVGILKRAAAYFAREKGIGRVKSLAADRGVVRIDPEVGEELHKAWRYLRTLPGGRRLTRCELASTAVAEHLDTRREELQVGRSGPRSPFSLTAYRM